MKALVTGGAGCIGSDLCSNLLKSGYYVLVIDNLSSGKIEHIQDIKDHEKFTFVKGDILDKKLIQKHMKGIDIVFHLAANSDVKYKEGDPTDEDLKLNTMATYNVLEAMKMHGIKKIVFTSTSAVYGEARVVPTPETYNPEPISLYASSKVSCEALISGFSHMFGIQAWVFRFANIVGPKTRKIGKTVISEFIERLKKNPRELVILGDGKQSKCYLTVGECIDGMMFVIEKSNNMFNLFNLGPEDSVTVNDIADIVIKEMKLKNVKIKYTGGDRGWTGDVPKFLLDVSKIKKLGWKSKKTSREAVQIATRSILSNGE